MGNFLKINKKVTDLGIKLVANQELCKLLYYADYNPWNNSNVDGYEHLLDKRLLFFVDKILGADDTGSYLTIKTGRITPIQSQHYRANTLIFSILIHYDARRVRVSPNNSAISYVSSADRGLYIADIIQDMVDKQTLGIGNTNLAGCTPIYTSSNTFSGYELVYNDVDFK